MGAATQKTDIGVADLELGSRDGQRVRLGALPGVQLVVLMRHRH